MRFGIFSVADHHPGEISRTVPELYKQLLEQVVAAEELGFDSFWMAEHHFHDYGVVPRASSWLAAASQLTKRIRLGSAVVVLPFDNPLRTAEDYAMVDILSGGRLSLGVGSGYLEHEFAGFNLDGSDKRLRFDESLDILLTAWQGERFSYEGKVHKVKDVRINVVPLQKPHPPVSIAVLRNQAAAFVGQKGLSMMMIPYACMESFDELTDTISQFRTGFAGSPRSGDAPTVHFGLHTYCAPSTAQARSEVRQWMDRYVRTRLYAKQRSFDSLIESDLVAFGDPSEIARVARRYEKAGMTDFLIIGNFGGLPQKNVLSSMELIAKQVLPEFAESSALLN